jgi:hypothetical protein
MAGVADAHSIASKFGAASRAERLPWSRDVSSIEIEGAVPSRSIDPEYYCHHPRLKGTGDVSTPPAALPAVAVSLNACLPVRTALVPEASALVFDVRMYASF